MFSIYDKVKSSFSKASRRCNSCEIAVGNCVDCCCGSFCELFGDCLEGIGNCIGDCFPRPFTFCFCLAFSIFVAPFVYGLIGFFTTGNAKCQTPLRESLLVMRKRNIFLLTSSARVHNEYGILHIFSHEFQRHWNKAAYLQSWQ